MTPVDLIQSQRGLLDLEEGKLTLKITKDRRLLRCSKGVMGQCVTCLAWVIILVMVARGVRPGIFLHRSRDEFVAQVRHTFSFIKGWFLM
jgi:hypothetical protein